MHMCRVFYEYEGTRISPWHDIPLSADNLPFEDPAKVRPKTHFIRLRTHTFTIIGLDVPLHL